MTNEIPEADLSEQMPRRRGPRPGASQSSAVVSIVVVAVAVIAGFFVLRAIAGDSDSAVIVPETTVEIDETPIETTTTTTVAPLVFDGAVVQVANANGIDGSAGQMSRALEAAGFTMSDPSNAAPSVGRIDASIIYYNAAAPAALPVADTLARLLGGDVSVVPMPEVPPTADGTVRGEVLLVLGNDKAGKTLEELAPATEAVAAPEVAGEGETIDDPSDDPAGTGDDG